MKVNQEINNKKIEEKVKKIFLQIFKFKISKFENLEFNKTKEWDSLKHIQLILALEKELKIRIKTSEVEKLTSYQKIIKHLI
jgi:acyl carrier protein|tara:strand:+ start:41 stop:286 length:246 start_codon:yes stop_codon:yes gene_type:complete